jgi:hypothetical protein
MSGLGMEFEGIVRGIFGGAPLGFFCTRFRHRDVYRASSRRRKGRGPPTDFFVTS